jgi:two-component system, NtrC family, response regulator HydG
MKKIRVFIIDDDRDFAESLSMAIEGRGFDVEVAFSGEEAIEKFHEKDFDIVFMDVKLPGKNGVESFIEIKKFKPGVRVVMMTGYSLEQLLEQAVRNGAWGVLHKPLDMNHIIKMLEKIKPDGILITDDDPDFVESIKDLLMNEGYNVFVAENGKEAIERIQKNNIDILILDLRMPILGGIETYLELKKSGHIVPTIIVTAFADEEAGTIEKLHSMSVSGILKKPFDPRELLDIIESLIAEGRS